MAPKPGNEQTDAASKSKINERRMQNSSPRAIKVIINFLPSVFVWFLLQPQILGKVDYSFGGLYHKMKHILFYALSSFYPLAEMPRKFKQMQRQNMGLTLLQGITKTNKE